MPENDNSRESELLRVVLEHPDADEPRKAYARWCEQQQDGPTRARAKFIRCQIDLAHVQLGEDSQPAYPLRYLSEKLTTLYGQIWGGALAKITRDYMFDRGFIEFVSLSPSDFLTHAEELFHLAPIRHLKLTSVEPELFDAPALKQIRSLELDRCDLEDADVARLARSPHLVKLRWLSLAENRITMEGARSLVGRVYLRNLAYVDFYGNAVKLNEQYAFDNGFVVDSFMPEDGKKLEATSGGPIDWLHHDAKSLADAVPNRFRIRAGGESWISDGGSIKVLPTLSAATYPEAFQNPPEPL